MMAANQICHDVRKSNRYSFIVKNLLSLVFGVIFLHVFAHEAEARERDTKISTTITYEYLLNNEHTLAIPTVFVNTYDYSTGKFNEERLPQPQYAIAIDEDTELNYSSAAKNLDTGGRQEGNIIQLKKGTVSVWIDQHQMLVSGKKPGAVEFRVMEFNLATRKLSVVNKFTSTSKYSVRLYPDFKGYTFTPADKLNNDSLSLKTIVVFSLETNREIAKVANQPRPSSWHKINNGKFDREPASNSMIIQEFTKAQTTPKEIDSLFIVTDTATRIPYHAKVYELFADGRKVELHQPKENPGIHWVKQVGAIKYVSYTDPSTKNRMIGYYKGNKIVPISSGNGYYQPSISFSPNNKYMIFSEKEIDPKTKKAVKKFTTTVVDLATVKVLYKLPPLEKYEVENNYEWVTDEIVNISFYSEKPLKRYLHIPSGITTLESHMPRPSGYFTFSKSKFAYDGNYSELLNPEDPFAIVIDGKPMTYSGQGPFRMATSDIKSEWYVPLREFAAAAGATVVDNANGWQVSRGTHTVQADKKKSITFKGTVYVPLAELTEHLGFAAAFTNNHSIYFFTPDITEDEVKNHFDGQYIFSKDHNIMFNIFTLTEGKWNRVSEEDKLNGYNTYFISSHDINVYNNFSLNFIDGRLAVVNVMDGMPIRNEGVDRGYVLKEEWSRLYGKGKAISFDIQLDPDKYILPVNAQNIRLQMLSYIFPDYGMLIKLSEDSRYSVSLYFVPNSK
ncbi:hypothetical protein [Cohnella terricola]|uniref:Copper amine oxidase N-terminal domain-containing protein n=1 Tax=Cohnella terricola TaxID=1289167 RepID=A0A559JQI7_9BACL|nr:hypothetical protein [Cohnella terricola]TVY02117.1 hypothetical protein FPZ45_06655 [Cohnella terricola]